MREYLKQAKVAKALIRATLKTATTPIKISTSIKIRFRRDEKEQLKCILSLPARYANGLDSRELAAVLSQLSVALEDQLRIATMGQTKIR